MPSTEDNEGQKKIFLDYNATTPLAKEVISSICDSLVNNWGNPSSKHQLGEKSRKAIEEARNHVAEMLNVESGQIIFTSGGTEANNMIINGIVKYFRDHQTATPGRPHIITTNVEHDSVILPIKELERSLAADCTVVEIRDELSKEPDVFVSRQVNQKGAVDADRIVSAIRENTCLISVMSANNETGVIMPISDIGEKLKVLNAERERRGLIKVLLHTDAAQLVGKERVDARRLNADYVTVVGHKFYGPRIGCVWARGPLYPVFHGGGQERRIRPGTENTPMIVGLGTAASLVARNVDAYRDRMLSARAHLERRLKEAFGAGVVVNCEASPRLPNTSNVSFVGDGLEGGAVLSECAKVIASVGAACHGSECSQVLINSGVPSRLARNAIRLSVGRETTREDVEEVVTDLCQAVARLKKRTP